MIPHGYARPRDVAEAIAVKRERAEAAYLAGGTTLVDLMREGVELPRFLIDINRIPGLTEVSGASGWR